MKKCLDEATIQAYADGELGAAQAQAAGAHFAQCGACAAALAEAEETNAFFASAVVGSEPVGLEADYERRTEIEEARRALGQLKEPMRSCLLLKQQGLSYREIAQTLSLNEANVGSLIARGRKEFMRVYGKIGGRR